MAHASPEKDRILHPQDWQKDSIKATYEAGGGRSIDFLGRGTLRLFVLQHVFDVAPPQSPPRAHPTSQREMKPPARPGEDSKNSLRGFLIITLTGNSGTKLEAAYNALIPHNGAGQGGGVGTDWWAPWGNEVVGRLNGGISCSREECTLGDRVHCSD
ncbi:hypothetical protein N7532_002909 [Penicillium argentinense]|uniref:Uncharacterized protein n=1 Tax=Penicillium argentinense TaxID=1131581 RepID=A0A9W9KKN3_9EURO|nr:uncharacterized protein N7532_002909 [Penicillium argentinense]KAJ5110264.1 hypothetical protein N7532_002909 [Penicillium argentinense]